MPAVNQAAISAGIIAVSVAVAAAIAVYESPELRRMADDLRRRIAIALHSLGDNIEPTPQRDPSDPLFNRPEDAEGFLQSRAEPGVVADDETRRRQREELLYWNSVHLQKKGQENPTASVAATDDDSSSFQRNSMYGGSTFDDFLRPDQSAEGGTYVFNTGADLRRADEGLVRRRGGAGDGVRGLNSALYANPFADENGIELDERSPSMQARITSPGGDDTLTDMYDATVPNSPVVSHRQAMSATMSPISPFAADENIGSILFDAAKFLEQQKQEQKQQGNLEEQSKRSETLDQEELGADEFMTAGQDHAHSHDAHASIQAWAQNSSNNGFYSPLPVSPAGPLSEPEIISEGALTPTDSASVVDITNDVASVASNENGSRRIYDVVSDDEDDGIATPVSWTEVGSVVSESDAGRVHA